MDRSISLQAAIDEIKEIYEWHDNVTKERIIEHFERLPSAQKIIRCRDCKWKNKHNCTRAVEIWVDDDKYCAWAERREE